jgi:hypothetical protein
MGEVRTVAQLMEDMGLPASIIGPMAELIKAAQAEADAAVSGGLEAGDLFCAFNAIQRVMDTIEQTRLALHSVGIHDTCARRIGTGFKNEITEEMTRMSIEYCRAILRFNDMLSFNIPVELSERIKAAHTKEESHGEEAEGKVEEEAELPSDSNEDGSADPEAVADEQQA